MKFWVYPDYAFLLKLLGWSGATIPATPKDTIDWRNTGREVPAARMSDLRHRISRRDLFENRANCEIRRKRDMNDEREDKNLAKEIDSKIPNPKITSHCRAIGANH